jgi:hypothetical protein
MNVAELALLIEERVALEKELMRANGAESILLSCAKKILRIDSRIKALEKETETVQDKTP